MGCEWCIMFDFNNKGFDIIPFLFLEVIISGFIFITVSAGLV